MSQTDTVINVLSKGKQGPLNADEYQDGSRSHFFPKPWYRMGHLIKGKTPGKRYVNENAVRARAGLMMLTAMAVLMVLLTTKSPKFLTYTLAPVVGWDMAVSAIFGITPLGPYSLLGMLLAWQKKPEWKPAGPKRFAWTLGVIMVCTCIVLGNLSLKLGVYVIAGTCLALTWFEAVLGFCLGCYMWNEIVAPLLGHEKCVECALELPIKSIVVSDEKENGSSRAGKVKPIIEANPVVLYGKTKCPFCIKAKALLNELNVSYLHVNLDEVGNARGSIILELVELTGRKTVPNIFIGGVSVGGCDEITKMHQAGKLLSRVAEAEAAQNYRQSDAETESKSQKVSA